MVSKGEIFDLFYKIQPVTRSGGGTSKNKMYCDFRWTEKVKEKIGNNTKLMAYYVKLLTRDVTIAPHQDLIDFK